MELLSSNSFPGLEKLNRQGKLDLLRELILKEMTTEKMDLLLELMLDGMNIVFVLNPDFRRNINTFKARYTFHIGSNGKGASVEFSPIPLFRYGRMIVKRRPADDANVSVTFEDGRSMAEFLFSGTPDIFGALLDNKLSFRGNLNYLFKFAYMAKHLQKIMGINLPA